MKVIVIPNAGEILEVLRPYLWAEISDQEVMDLLNTLADCGFIVSHEIDIDDDAAVQIDRNLQEAKTQGLTLSDASRLVRAERQSLNESQHMRWRRRTELKD